MTEPKPSEQPSEKPSEKPSGLHSCGTVVVAGITAIGGLIAAMATLVTALYAAGLLRGHPATPTVATTDVPAQTAAVATDAPSPVPAKATKAPPSAGATAQGPAAALLADDFTTASSGWEVEVTAEDEVGYENGEYRIAVHAPRLVVWGSPEKPAYDLADFALEVDARSVEGPLDNQYGVMVRCQKGVHSLYMLVISSDGQYSVQMLQDDEWTELVPWALSDAIRQGHTSNHLRVVCQGELMQLFVNGKLLTEAKDRTFRSGNVGLVAGTFDESGVVVHFDNLTVKALSGQ